MADANAVLERWLECVNGGELEAVLGLYDEGAVLIPTFSNRIHATPAMIREYFERLAANPELAVVLHPKTLTVQDLPGDLACFGGIYRWRLAVDGEPLEFEARFSFVFAPAAQRPILHHHSSQVPRML